MCRILLWSTFFSLCVLFVCSNAQAQDLLPAKDAHIKQLSPGRSSHDPFQTPTSQPYPASGLTPQILNGQPEAVDNLFGCPSLNLHTIPQVCFLRCSSLSLDLLHLATLSDCYIRAEQLRQAIQEELNQPDLAQSKISIFIRPLNDKAPILAIEPDAHRLPASNAKLLTTAAAALLLPGQYRFITEVHQSSKRGLLYLWGTGDPIFSRSDVVRMAQQVYAAGIRVVRGIVLDESYFAQPALAPGFESFKPGAYYRPPSSALNLEGNAITIYLTSSVNRKRPRVQVLPATDYVIVRKSVRFARAKRGPKSHKAQIVVTTRERGSRLVVTVNGIIGRKVKFWSTRQAVPEPAMYLGWTFRRALINAGVRVTGTIRRGRRPASSKVIAKRQHSLEEVLLVTNQNSDNLAAETLVRAMSFVQIKPDQNQEEEMPEEVKEEMADVPSTSVPGSWNRGLKLLHQTLATKLGLLEFKLGNGSGLHRRAWVTARVMVDLLNQIYTDQVLHKFLLPTLAIAGKKGTLAHRMRGTAADGFVYGKTGTLGGARALSGFVNLEGKQPIIFSILMNGHNDQAMRDRIDSITTLIARYSRGLPIIHDFSASQPAVDLEETLPEMSEELPSEDNVNPSSSDN
jgi:D-alanyl-D-alanine carboxypeptidase/D-alanyl-D-alanine-endopeptidase (penicillin-binding protein 4)